MITVWVIGLILSLLGIYLFKNSRTIDIENLVGEVVYPGKPILKVWSLILFILGAIVPIFNSIMGCVMIIWWAIAVHRYKDWSYPETSVANKIIQFLNKSIK